MLFILWYFIFIPAGTPATLKPKSVNLALETVLEFDKKSLASDVKIIDSVQNFLTKVRNALDDNKVSRRSLGTGTRMKFVDFVENTLIVLKTYTDSELEDLVKTIDIELRKYHYRGCKFYELLENMAFRMFIADTLFDLTNVSGRNLRLAIDYLLIRLKDKSFSKKEIEFIEYLNSLYPAESTKNMFYILNSLQNYKTNSKRSSNDLQVLVKNGIRNLIFDHYSKLNNNARKDLKLKINTYFEYTPKELQFQVKNVTETIALKVKGVEPFRIHYTLGDFNNSPPTTVATTKKDITRKATTHRETTERETTERETTQREITQRETTQKEITLKELKLNIAPEQLLSLFTEAFKVKPKKSKLEKQKKKKKAKVKKEKKPKRLSTEVSSTELTTDPYKTITLWIEPRKKKRGSKYEKEFKKVVLEAKSTPKKKSKYSDSSSEKKKKRKQKTQTTGYNSDNHHSPLTTKKPGPQQSEEMEQIKQMYNRITQDSDLIKSIEITEPTTRSTKPKKKKKKKKERPSKEDESENEIPKKRARKEKKKSKKSKRSREPLRGVTVLTSTKNKSDRTRKLLKDTVEGDGLTIETFETNHPEKHSVYRKNFGQFRSTKRHFIKKKRLQRKEVTPMTDSTDTEYTDSNEKESFLMNKINDLEKEIEHFKRRMASNAVINVTEEKTEPLSTRETTEPTTLDIEITRTTERTSMKHFEDTLKTTVLTEKPTISTTIAATYARMNLKNNEREYFIPKLKHPNETVVKILKPMVNYESEATGNPKDFERILMKDDRNEKRPDLKTQLKTLISEWPHESNDVHKINLVKQPDFVDVDIVIKKQNNTAAPQNMIENNTTAKNQATTKTDKTNFENANQTTKAAFTDYHGRRMEYFNSVPPNRFIR